MKLTLLPGDGIGPEITQATAQALQALAQRFALGLDLEWHEIGLAALERSGSTLPPGVEAAVRASEGVVLGPISTAIYPPREKGGINVSAALRISLDLYANLRPSRTREALPHYGRTEMDLVIVRENTEGFYSDRNMASGPGELMPVPGVALSLRKVTAEGSRRIVRAACELALRRRRKVTAVHKANVLKLTDGLFLEEARRVAREYEVEYEEQLVDSMAALLVRQADRYDVIVTTNMFGDILSDEAAELCGSLGLGGSLNAGDHHAVAQAAHGSAPDIAGQDRANPVSLLLSAGQLLEWLGRKHSAPAFGEAAAHLERQVDVLLANSDTRTGDLGGPLGTRAFTEALCLRLKEAP